MRGLARCEVPFRLGVTSPPRPKAGPVSSVARRCVPGVTTIFLGREASRVSGVPILVHDVSRHLRIVSGPLED